MKNSWDINSEILSRNYKTICFRNFTTNFYNCMLKMFIDCSTLIFSKISEWSYSVILSLTDCAGHCGAYIAWSGPHLQRTAQKLRNAQRSGAEGVDSSVTTIFFFYKTRGQYFQFERYEIIGCCLTIYQNITQNSLATIEEL